MKKTNRQTHKKKEKQPLPCVFVDGQTDGSVTIRDEQTNKQTNKQTDKQTKYFKK